MARPVTALLPRKRYEVRDLGVFSVSQSMSETVKRYLAGQREHHRKQSFRQEYLEMLRRHGVEFDERYVFDEEIVT